MDAYTTGAVAAMEKRGVRGDRLRKLLLKLHAAEVKNRVRGRPISTMVMQDHIKEISPLHDIAEIGELAKRYLSKGRAPVIRGAPRGAVVKTIQAARRSLKLHGKPPKDGPHMPEALKRKLQAMSAELPGM